MEEPASASQPPRRRIWILWASSVLLMFGLSTALRYFLHLFEALYQQWEFKELPRLTEASLAVGPYLWIGVMALAIESFRRIRTRDPVAALSWCLLAALVFMAIFSLMVFALYLPLLIVQVTLSK